MDIVQEHQLVAQEAFLALLRPADRPKVVTCLFKVRFSLLPDGQKRRLVGKGGRNSILIHCLRIFN